MTRGLPLMTRVRSASKLKLHHNLGANKFLEPTERVPGSLAAMTGG